MHGMPILQQILNHEIVMGSNELVFFSPSLCGETKSNGLETELNLIRLTARNLQFALHRMF